MKQNADGEYRNDSNFQVVYAEIGPERGMGLAYLLVGSISLRFEWNLTAGDQ